MMRAIHGRQWATIVAAAIVAMIGLAAPAWAQTGMVKGKVVDSSGKPVEGAKVAIEFKDGITRKFEVKTNKKGEYIQIGLQPGNYQITAAKDGVGTATQSQKVGLGDGAPIDLTLAAAAAGGGEASKEELAFRKVFNEGVTASKAGNQDAALKGFQDALALRPDCYACAYNIAGAYLAKKDDAKAEEALLAAAKLDPNAADPYHQLANLYNGQKKFDKAAEMSAEASKRGGGAGGAGGAGAETLYNQGVVLWNAGKIGDAKAAFEGAIKAKPDYADAHYWIGMANLNEGKMPEAATAFEKYMQLAPTGQYADQAKGILATIKK
jgi:tetratricopeptide (TPR) repeat protein